MTEGDLEEATWAGLETEAAERQGREQAVRHAVTVALRTLRAANLAPSFGFDEDDAETLWSTRLKDYPPGAIIATAGEWAASAADSFPTLAEFESAVSVMRRRQAVGERAPGTSCPECGADDEEPGGWVNLTDPTFGGSLTVRPCSLCRPGQFALHKASHFGPRVENRRCHCNTAGCRDARRETAAAGSR